MAYLGEEIKKLRFWPYETSAEIRRCDRCGARPKSWWTNLMEAGFTYFDTAWMYCGFASENATKEVLVKRYPRDSYTLATKLHAGFIKTKEDRDAVFNKQLEKTGVEFFDYYLLHDIGQDHYKIYNDLDCFNWIMDKKKKGLVKHVGFSFHDKCPVT